MFLASTYNYSILACASFTLPQVARTCQQEKQKPPDYRFLSCLHKKHYLCERFPERQMRTLGNGALQHSNCRSSRSDWAQFSYMCTWAICLCHLLCNPQHMIIYSHNKYIAAEHYKTIFKERQGLLTTSRWGKEWRDLLLHTALPQW